MALSEKKLEELLNIKRAERRAKEKTEAEAIDQANRQCVRNELKLVVAYFDNNKSNLARALKGDSERGCITSASIYRWGKSGKIPVARALEIEKLTDNKFTRERLCPQLEWG